MSLSIAPRLYLSPRFRALLRHSGSTLPGAFPVGTLPRNGLCVPRVPDTETGEVGTTIGPKLAVFCASSGRGVPATNKSAGAAKPLTISCRIESMTHNPLLYRSPLLRVPFPRPAPTLCGHCLQAGRSTPEPSLRSRNQTLRHAVDEFHARGAAHPRSSPRLQPLVSAGSSRQLASSPEFRFLEAFPDPFRILASAVTTSAAR